MFGDKLIPTNQNHAIVENVSYLGLWRFCLWYKIIDFPLMEMENIGRTLLERYKTLTIISEDCGLRFSCFMKNRENLHVKTIWLDGGWTHSIQCSSSSLSVENYIWPREWHCTSEIILMNSYQENLWLGFELLSLNYWCMVWLVLWLR